MSFEFNPVPGTVHHGPPPFHRFQEASVTQASRLRTTFNINHISNLWRICGVASPVGIQWYRPVSLAPLGGLALVSDVPHLTPLSLARTRTPLSYS